MPEVAISALSDVGDILPGDIVPATRGGVTQAVHVPARGVSIMNGVADAFTLDGTLSPIVNYTIKSEQGDMAGSASEVAGEITTPSAGFFNLSALVVGSMASPSINESTTMFLRIGNAGGLNGDYPIAVHTVQSAMVGEASWAASLGFNLPAAAVLTLLIDASSGMGLFTISNCTFEARSE